MGGTPQGMLGGWYTQGGIVPLLPGWCIPSLLPGWCIPGYTSQVVYTRLYLSGGVYTPLMLPGWCIYPLMLPGWCMYPAIPPRWCMYPAMPPRWCICRQCYPGGVYADNATRVVCTQPATRVVCTQPATRVGERLMMRRVLFSLLSSLFNRGIWASLPLPLFPVSLLDLCSRVCYSAHFCSFYEIYAR